MTPFLALGLPNGSEMLLIFLVVLLLFGSKKLPELARGLGKSMQEFRKAREDFESELHTAKTELTVAPAPDRQLAHNTSGALENQVRELQEQLRQMHQQNQTLQGQEVVLPAKPVAATPVSAEPAPAAAAVVTPVRPAPPTVPVDHA